ncbi:hypothetical protein ACVBEQ_16990 [Nakamurella sp. GG22]
MTTVRASSGGTEYRFPRKDTRACAVTGRGTATTVENAAAGTGRNLSVSARAATVQRVPVSSITRTLVSVFSAQNTLSRAWACAAVTSSGRVRHQRCATVWFAFSTTPLRFPRRGGQG